MPHKGKRAEFAITLPNDGTLKAIGSFREDGHNVGMVSYAAALAPWIRLPACSLSELRTNMTDAARSLGGKLSVEYTPLTDDEGSLEPRKDCPGEKIQIPIRTLRGDSWPSGS